MTGRSERRLLLVWLSGVGALALFIGLAWYLSPLDPGVVPLQLAFTPRRFGAIVHAWPAEHLARYRAHLPADFLLLACYGAFGHLLATRTVVFSRWSRDGQAAAKWALPLAALCDVVEDGFHLWLTEAPRFGIAWAYEVSAIAAGIKWVLLAAWAIGVVVALYGVRRSRGDAARS